MTAEETGATGDEAGALLAGLVAGVAGAELAGADGAELGAEETGAEVAGLDADELGAEETGAEVAGLEDAGVDDDTTLVVDGVATAGVL